MSTSITIPQDYGWVILAASVIGFQVIYQGGRYAAGGRKVFNKDFWNSKAGQAITEEHKKATGETYVPKGGYPDHGNGRYSQALSYADWFKLNNAQRVHGNYVEGVSSILTFTLLGGLAYPRFSAAAALMYVVGREIYAIGYTKKGPSARTAGAIIFDLALVALFGASVATGWKAAGVSKLLGF